MNKKTWAWAMYDWANSAYATVVMAGFFPLFFKQYWANGLDAQHSTFYLGIANAMGSLLVVVLAPWLGAVADMAGRRKAFLWRFMLFGVLSTMGFYLVGQGQWWWAAVLYMAATLGFMGGNVFYDALLVEVVDQPSDMARASSWGFALGYLGGGVLFALCVAMTLMPQAFHLADAGEAVRWSFVMTGLWWAGFSLPLLLQVHEPARTQQVSFAAGYRRLLDTLRHVRRYPAVWSFLLAYWLYIDGVDTVIRMAVDYGLALGFDSSSLIIALLITQFVGFPAALLYGRLAERIGLIPSLYAGIAAYGVITIAGSLMQNTTQFYALAVGVALVQGGIQAISRAYYAALVPATMAAEFFGFYNMMGKFAAVLGPLMVGWVSLMLGSNRLGLLSLLILFAAGALLLFWHQQRIRSVR